MESGTSLPSPWTAVWVSLIPVALLLGLTVISYSFAPEGTNHNVLFLALIPGFAVVTYVLMLRSLRAFDLRLRTVLPGALVFFVARSEALQHGLADLTGEPVALGQFVGVSADAEGLLFWSGKNKGLPITVVDWTELRAVSIGGTPIDMSEHMALVSIVRQLGWNKLGYFGVPAITLDLHRGGENVSLPLALYSARTGYPASRTDFALTVTSFLHLRAEA
ncbi:hypothetical protein D6T64_03665 [Cryobacterium melibiosiphilum]|uniref:Uncharacterized protein n=1 Tax=Cryobacterium melibiosiphilum TaxID=995039 RepID=A0A3A5MNT3_9MICO|nr:hypothetical protein [Cryobacterium melibiosiphilum]RJT90625.1 hypothetical protein D6T64_03665 [Cryobacterium melibiosiphilum]